MNYKRNLGKKNISWLENKNKVENIEKFCFKIMSVFAGESFISYCN